MVIWLDIIQIYKNLTFEDQFVIIFHSIRIRQGMERDLRYVAEFPKGQKYVAVFAHGGHFVQ